MNKAIELIKQPRIKILDTISAFNIEQLNKIPAGFNNNIIWNLGHMIAAQQSICYTRGGLPRIVDEDFFTTYKPGSKPERFIDQLELDMIKKMMFSTLERLEADLENNIFTGYPTWTTHYGAELTSINDAVGFLPFHEGLHVGYIMSLRKVV